jgi:glutathione S-transferase
MKLIGMLDSPYVRRCAISMKLMGVPFDHQSLSVFRTYDQFRLINPVVKAPTLICDDGAVLMDSTLILDYVEGRVVPEKRLMPADGMARREALRLHGLALAACEKCVQIVYEFNQRPEEKRHAPWLDRVMAQANAAYAELERTAGARSTAWLQGDTLNASDVVVAITWRFGQYYNAKYVPEALYPALVAHSQRAEALPEFASTPLD